MAMATTSPLPSLPSSTTTQSLNTNHPHHLPPSSLVFQRNSKPETITVRSRLSKLCQEGQPYLARQLFDTITRPKTVIWNTIIIGFICNSMSHEAIIFYARMKTSSPHTKCDSYTYSSVLKACAETRNLKLGKAVHCHLIRCLTNPSKIVYNSLLNMYATCSSTIITDTYAGYDVVCKVFNSTRKKNVVAWNTIISWFVKTERQEKAVREFRNMMRMGLRPSPVSFVNLFPAVSSLAHAHILHGLFLKLGSEYVNDLFVVSSAIFMYSELGCVDFGRKIFDCCLERNTEVWNTMVGGYVQNNRPVEGIKLFVQAISSEQKVVDDVTLLTVLSAVSQSQQLDLGKQLHAYIVRNSREVPVILVNAIIVMYSRCSSIRTSFEVFKVMPERDLISWNTMVSGFVQNGLNDEGLMLVYEMQKNGFVVDSVTSTSLLSAASNLRNLEIGKQTHAFILRHGISFEGMDGYLIDMYSKSGLIRSSQLIYEKYRTGDTDQAICNAMICGYTQNGLIEEALCTFRESIEHNKAPNAVTLASVLPACGQVGNMNLGKQLHGYSVRHWLDQNVYVATALIDMYSKTGGIVYAENVFSNVGERNSVTYTTMILGYGQHGMGERALSLFHSMKDSGIVPDVITFISILTSCSYGGFVEEGLRIFKSMEMEYNIKPSAGHYCCVVDLLGRAGRVREAHEFVKELGEEGDKVEIWGSLLGACRIHGEYEVGELIAKKLVRMDRGNNVSGYHVLVSNMYAENEKWISVDRVRKGMREKGLRKEVGCSWIEIAGCVNCFVSKDQKHGLSDHIYTMLQGLALEMKESNSSFDIDVSMFDE